VLSKTVRIVLNGGLGTSMGLVGPKSLLKVKHGRSFLEILLRQAERSNSRLALMNSFNTHTATLAALDTLKPSQPPLCFLQHKFPKILQGALAPVSWPANRELEWNPPGHGDVYAALYASGMLQKLLDEGVRHAFICNSDNLGAGIDEALLGYFAENRFPFMMEVAEKTPADEKGRSPRKPPPTKRAGTSPAFATAASSCGSRPNALRRTWPPSRTSGATAFSTRTTSGSTWNI